MFPITGKKHEVFDSIVTGVPVDMVNDFCREKDSADVRFHYEAVFPNVSLGVGVRMVWAKGSYISLGIYPVSTLPTWIKRTAPNERLIDPPFVGFGNLGPSFY